MKTEQISIRLTAVQLQAIDDIASKTIGERSDHIRKALDQYIGRYGQVDLPDTENDDDDDFVVDEEQQRKTHEMLLNYSDDDGDPYPAYLIE
jgi:metal-responsive CopG/Arc/MetJ family transcriptional regulator